MYDLDKLQLYRGRDIYITDKIIITQPSIGQIEEFGEKRYFTAVNNLTSVGADLKWQLWDFYNIDYTKIEDYELFIKLVYKLVSSKKYLYKELTENPDKYEEQISQISDDDLREMLVNPLQLILKDLDLADFQVMENKNNGQIVLYNREKDIIIDRLIYSQIIDIVRKIHGLKRNNQIPANERTKMDLIDDSRDESIAASKRPYESVLLPLISSLAVKCGMCGDERIWDMKIGMLFYNIKRAFKIQDATLLLQGAYSGFASLKGIDKSRLDWTGDI